MREVMEKSSVKLPHSKALIVLGDNEAGKTTLIARLSGNEDPKKSPGIEYHHIDIKDEERDDQTKLGVWVLDGDMVFIPLLSNALSAYNFADCMAVLVVSMSEPWNIIDRLEFWVELLKNYINKIELSLEEMNEFKESSFLNLIFSKGIYASSLFRGQFLLAHKPYDFHFVFTKFLRLFIYSNIIACRIHWSVVRHFREYIEPDSILLPHRPTSNASIAATISSPQPPPNASTSPTSGLSAGLTSSRRPTNPLHPATALLLNASAKYTNGMDKSVVSINESPLLSPPPSSAAISVLSKVELPLTKGALINNLGIPLMVVVTKITN
ncbi:unnamed protein product [Protopolystoma xenopodis]|uniref:Dynein light intermediate chain n=1 Tax=Protopolystoma xenopodis TaxID=117903 RepID=A0A3S5BTG8_9PLAT|nr:unnamed protein product [Protopolystoma xenopodis]